MPPAGASPSSKPFNSNGLVFIYYPHRFFPYPVWFFDLKPQSILLITRKKYLSKVRVNQTELDTFLAFKNGIEFGAKAHKHPLGNLLLSNKIRILPKICQC